jgi:acyl-CoA dehydrogenase
MNFELPEEIALLQKTVRRFVEEELIPLEKKVPEADELPPDVQAKLESKTKELGLWLLEVPQEYGGAGLSCLAIAVIYEEVSRSSLIPFRSSGIFGPKTGAILLRASDEQKERYLFPLIRGEKRACFAMTEPHAGSDPASMRTTAIPDGDDYVLNGIKTFITAADRCDFAQVFAVTDPSKRANGGITCFLVDMNAPGCRVTNKFKMMIADSPCEITFTDCRVPANNILGGLGRGFQTGQRWLTFNRTVNHGARALGVAARCLEMSVRYAKQRVTFGKPLSERQAIQWMLADSEVALHAARLMVYHAAWNYDRGKDVRHETAMVKLFCSEMVGQVVDRAIQIHGAMGLTTELPFERWYRDVRSRRITEGASEIQRMLIARRLIERYD